MAQGREHWTRHGYILKDSNLAYQTIARYPTTPQQHALILKSDNLFSLSSSDQVNVLILAKELATQVQTITKARRCGLAYDGHRTIHILPMHHLPSSWQPIRAPEAVFNEEYPGFLWTKSAPHLPTPVLDHIREKLVTVSQLEVQDNSFLGETSNDNLFAKLIRNEIPQWRFWETSQHLAFLTPFGNTPGATVVIPRKHLPSDVFSLEHDDYVTLVQAGAEVTKVLCQGMKTSRIGMFFEGYEIDYTHVKFYPIMDDTAPLEGPSDEFSDRYPGYLTTRLGPQMTDPSYFEELQHAHQDL